jgi:hypothetical protein
LRWIASMTAGVTAFFVFNIISLGIARAQGLHAVHGGAAALLTLGAWIFTMAVVLATEDYLTKRYGFTVTRPAQQPASERVGPPADQ